jgi:hypothetical protein
MIRKIFLAVFGLFAALALSAQNHKVVMKLVDSITGEPVGFATVSLTPERGSAKYSLSDADGNVNLEKVRAGKYTLKAELLGYNPFSQAVTVEDKDLDLGTLKMDLNQEELDAASVSATGNPIIIKKDTVEYNASSYKITDDNMLVDLLKKLPGIEVGDDGSITSNGETISRITIDGKTFFLDDPQVATSNLPAKLVEKVKVIKKKSEQAEFTGIDDGNEETIIDLTVQKGMMNGVFGNLVAGGGHDIPSEYNTLNDWRYQANGMVGRFTDNSQLSLLGNVGNGPRGVGFNNFSGGMMGGMMGGMGGGMMGGGMMGGGMGGGMMGGGGITTSWMIGANASMDLLDGDMELAVPYQYQGSINNSVSDSYKETYVAQGNTLINNTLNDNVQDTWGHSISMRLDHKFSDNTSLMIQPQFNFGGGSYVQQSLFDTWRNAAEDGNQTNNGFSSNSGVNKNLTFSGRGIFRQRLGMPGRTLSLNFNWNIRDNRMNGYNQSLTNTYIGELIVPDVVNQRIDQVQKSQTLGASLVYTEPLGGNFYMEGRYQVNWTNSLTDKKAYDSGNPNDKYSINPAAIADIFMDYTTAGETPNATYSNNVVSRNLNQTIGLAFMYQEDWIRAQLGASAIPTNQYNLTNGKEYDPGTIWNFAPRAMLMYEFNENANVRINYNGRSGQPSTSQLNPVLDNSNPLSLSLGNPYLTPYFNHNMRLELEYSNRATFFTARFNLNGGMNQNPISNANWYDVGGRQYTFPVNGKNTFNGGGSIMVNAPIAKSNFSISNMINLNYSMTSSYIGAGTLDMSRYFKTEGEKEYFDYEAFHDYYFVTNPDQWAKDFLDNETRTLTVMENFTGTYRSDDIEVRVGFRTNVRKPWYTVQNAVAATWNNAVNGSFMWTVGNTGLSINTDANYRWYRGYTTEQPSEFIWNASISKTIFRGQATIALQAYDILGQSRAQSVSITDNYYQETNNRTRLGRYIMLTFSWRFGTFGGGRGMFGGMGGGRGGRNAGGPPMGGGFGGGMGGGFRPM